MENDHSSTGVLLLNIGSPSSPRFFDVAAYLSRFLGERRIISLPWIARKILVNGIIVPFRTSGSASRYRKLQSMYDGHFPLPLFGRKCREHLQEVLSDKASVFFAMAYGDPTIEDTIDNMMRNKISRIIILPLFPQYASSSTGVVLEKVIKRLTVYDIVPEIRSIDPFFRHPLFVNAFAERINEYHPERYDQVLFCYHSLPVQHVRSASGTPYCYLTSCNETTRLIAARAQLAEGTFETVFQSNMSNNWQGPFASRVIEEKARSGCKKILIVAPSFVADCLETSLELGVEYRQMFIDHGGEDLTLVESLNTHPEWIRCLESICMEHLKESSPGTDYTGQHPS